MPNLESGEITKHQIIDIVAEKINYTKRATSEIVDALLSEIIQQLQIGRKVVLQGFGTFLVRSRATRRGRNPRTGEDMQIPEQITPGFSAGKTFKGIIKKDTV